MDALVTTALLGTAQRRTDDLTTGAPIDRMIPPESSGEVERRLLLQAGALAIYRAAGAMPTTGVSVPDTAPGETLPACSSAAAELVRGFLSGTSPELLPEALERLKLAGQRLPFDLLPQALSAREHRGALAPVLGERGRWLSQFNPAWSWVRSAVVEHAGPLPDDAETIWQEGTPAERVAILRRLRVADPARAREWLSDVWKRERAEMRADLLAVLETGLTTDDETFLEAALDDRGSAIRAQAAALLARLPESALAQRMVKRADAVLGYAAGKLTVRPPREFEKAAARDGLFQKPPAGTGEQAWWIMQYLSRVPLAHWSQRFGVMPDVLIANARNTEWIWPVLEGWSRAFLLHGGAIWILPLWHAWSAPVKKGAQRQRDQYNDIRRELAPHIPREELERIAQNLMEERLHGFPLTLGEVLGVLPMPWSADVGMTYLKGLRQFSGTLTLRSTDFEPWDDTLESAALALPQSCFSAALEPFTLPEGNSWYLHEFDRKLEMFAGALHLRQRVMEEIPL